MTDAEFQILQALEFRNLKGKRKEIRRMSRSLQAYRYGKQDRDSQLDRAVRTLMAKAVLF